MIEIARLKFEILEYAASKEMNIDKMADMLNKLTDKAQEQVKNCSIPFVSESSFNDEKFIEALFAEYNKSYAQTKQGQHYPQWLNDEQLKWVLKVANNCC